MSSPCGGRDDFMRGIDVTAIVPAYNEESTVEGVIRTLVSSGLFREVIVVDDGSTDGTGEAARSSGARVITSESNMGKGAAMSRGVEEADTDAVCFFDADLRGLNRNNVLAVVSPVTRGEVGMNVGIVDRGPAANAAARHLPLVSGQRALLKEIFMLIPHGHLTGYGVEVALNYSCKVNGYGVGVVGLRGVSVRRKTQKVGLAQGLVQYARMWFWVGIWMLRVRLDRNSFISGEAHHPF